MEIIKFKLVEKNTLVAYFDLKVAKWGDFCIRNMQLHRKGSQTWINFPSFKIEGEDGKPKYLSHCHFMSREMHDQFSSRVLPLLSEELKKAKAAPAQQESYEQEEIPF